MFPRSTTSIIAIQQENAQLSQVLSSYSMSSESESIHHHADTRSGQGLPNDQSPSTQQQHPPSLVKVDRCIKRLQSTRIPLDNSRITLAQLSPALNRDLKHRVAYGEKEWLSTIYPDATCFGFVIDESFTRAYLTHSSSILVRITDETHVTAHRPLHLLSPRKITEKVICKWLNHIICDIALALHRRKQNDPYQRVLEPLRYWTSHFSSLHIKDEAVQSKPDVALVEMVSGKRMRHKALRWRHIVAVTEVTQRGDFHSDMKSTVTAKSFLMLLSQPDRIYAPTIAIHGQTWHFIVTDREGQIISSVGSFGVGPNCEVDTINFIRIVTALAFLPSHQIGLDKSIVRKEIEATALSQADAYRKTNINDNPRTITDGPDTDNAVGVSDGVAGLNLGPVGSVSTFTIGSSAWSDLDSREPSVHYSFPSITTQPDLDDYEDDTAGLSTVSVGGICCEIVEELFRANTLVGRATRVWKVKWKDDKGRPRTGVVKDSWIWPSHGHEGRFLKDLNNIPNAVRCEAYNVVTGAFGIESMTTAFLRQKIHFHEDLVHNNRQRRRVLVYPHGVLLSNFRSILELLGILSDIIEAIKFLQSRMKAHRDISFNNILIEEDGEWPDAVSDFDALRKQRHCRRGLLIDFDYASDIALDIPSPGTTNTPSVNRTGTSPFMALELLLHGGPHRMEHDLESLFYVLIFICIHMSGPTSHFTPLPINEDHYRSPDSRFSPLKAWFGLTVNFQTLGWIKCGQLFAQFEDTIIAEISPYFSPMKKYIRDMWYAFFPLDRRSMGLSGRQAVQSHITPDTLHAIIQTAMMDPAISKEIVKDPLSSPPSSPSGDQSMSKPGNPFTKAKTHFVYPRQPKTPPSKPSASKKSSKSHGKRSNVKSHGTPSTDKSSFSITPVDSSTSSSASSMSSQSASSSKRPLEPPSATHGHMPESQEFGTGSESSHPKKRRHAVPEDPFDGSSGSHL